ncbi:MAG: MarR family winged helix-turn-helix transcriptional regulator [Bacillota bacterium]|nr:MarR family winged helix-turn-helix transcriptional regulator [Bacillota bacterium]
MTKEPIGKYVAAIHRNTQSIINYKLRDLDIKSGQHDFLLVISKNEGISQKDLSSFLYVGKSTTAKAVKNLINCGYIVSKQNNDDKRFNNLYLTEKGRKIAPMINSTFLEMMEIYSKDFSEDETEHIIVDLKKVLKNITDERKIINSDI